MYESIPNELRTMNQWVAWKRVFDGIKVKKVPVDPHTKSNASVVDPDTWSSFDAACSVNSDGIGFVLTADDGIVGIDLDNCIVNGFITTAAFKIVEHFNSYTEVSPSGTGLHIFIRARLEKSRKWTKGNKAIEIYGDRRFLTVTGDKAPPFRLAIHDRQDELDAFLARYDRASPAIRSITRTVTQRDDEAVLQCAANARNGERFRMLWSGDTSAYDYDHNRADLALCNFLWYWSGDEAQVDRLFRRSGLMRDKWDDQRGASTYGENAIKKAMGIG